MEQKGAGLGQQGRGLGTMDGDLGNKGANKLIIFFFAKASCTVLVLLGRFLNFLGRVIKKLASITLLDPGGQQESPDSPQLGSRFTGKFFRKGGGVVAIYVGILNFL